jgi:hypothetical protein
MSNIQTNESTTEEPQVDDKYQGSGSGASIKAYLIMISLIIVSAIAIPLFIYATIKYKLYGYIWPFVSTYIFVHIRYFWIFVIIATIYTSFKMVQQIIDCITQIKKYYLYTKYPLKDPETMKTYKYDKKINTTPGVKKKKDIFITVMKVWFGLMIFVYFLAILFIIIGIMLSCYMVGHYLSWMDYFWFLR